MHEEHSLSDMYNEIPAGPKYANPGRTLSISFSTPAKGVWPGFSLLLAEFGEPGEPEPFIPPITQETCRDGRHNPLPCLLLHESLSQARPY